MQVEIVNSLYTKDEIITAAICLGKGKYLLDPTGKEDCTSVIQAALTECANAGGGTVWLPAGYYRITDRLYIPTYVTLRGDYQDPDFVKEDLKYGTILLADLKENTPLLYIGGSAGINGLTIYYLDQDMEAIREHEYAIYNEGKALHDEDLCLHVIKNCTIINGYKGIGICDSFYTKDGRSAQTYIHNVKGTFLKIGLYNYNASDNGNTTGFTAKADYWTEFVKSSVYEEICTNLNLEKKLVEKEKIRSYSKQYGIGLHIGDLEGDFFADIFVESFFYGIQVDAGVRTCYYGDLYNLDISDCEIGIQFNELSGFGVNIASSKFYKNGMDIINRANVPIKLADVHYMTQEGTEIYRTSDHTYQHPIKGYHVPHYGVTKKNLEVFSYHAEGEMSFTQQLQQSLDKIGNIGGGIVYVPAGHYVLEKAIQIPENTELRGCAGTMVRPSPEVEGGTVLEVYFGKDSKDPVKDAAIVLKGKNAGVRGLILNFPLQTPNEPIATGYGVAGKKAAGAFVTDCCISGFSHGVYMEKCDDYVITGVTFANLLNNIKAKDCIGGHISSGLQNLTPIGRNTYNYPTWSQLQRGTVTPTFQFTSTYLDCMIFDHSIKQMICHWYAYRPHHTIVLENDAEVVALNYGAGGLEGDSIGVLITAKTVGCKARSVNSHQKNRYTVNAPAGADIQVYNRMTLEKTILVSSEDNYRSVGADIYELLEPGITLFDVNATEKGYDLSKGGKISFESNYERYSDAYDFSEYRVMTIEFTETDQTYGGGYEIQFNGKTVCFDIEKSGKQKFCIPMDSFGEDLSKVKMFSFSFKTKLDVERSKVHKIYLCKK